MPRSKNRVLVQISVTPDTKERLKQYAYEHHTNVSQAITDLIWGQKITNEQIRGQMSFNCSAKNTNH